MSMMLWHDMFFKATDHSLIQTCFKLIRDERGGKAIDSDLVRQVVLSYGTILYISIFFCNFFLLKF